MSTTEPATAIDEKKEPDASQTNKNANLKGFITNYLSSIIFTIGISVLLIGSLGLYTTKVAQSNILPDNINLEPYTNVVRNVQEMAIDINIIKDISWNLKVNNIVSQKAYFNEEQFLKNFNHTLTGKVLDSFKSISSPSSGIIGNAGLYISSIYESMMTKILGLLIPYFCI